MARYANHARGLASRQHHSGTGAVLGSSRRYLHVGIHGALHKVTVLCRAVVPSEAHQISVTNILANANRESIR